MKIACLILGIGIILAVLLDAFETVVLPRRVTRQFRLTAWFYRRTWRPWSRVALWAGSAARRESLLGYFGPLSLILLLIVWAAGLIFGFALVQYGSGAHVLLGDEPITFGTLLYHSGETFFTLGYGDVTPASATARLVAVMEAGMGFAFLGVVIGYLPTIYSAFSRREIEISLLDARAGSPPTAAEMLSRFGVCPQQATLDSILREWERWSAQVLESHLSYPVLSFFRSQHNNQSWLGALTMILDTSALVMAGVDDIRAEQAQLTFAAARHAVVDLAQVVNAKYDAGFPNRLPRAELTRLRRALGEVKVELRDGVEFEQRLTHLRLLYEPYAQAMARKLIITLPPWIHPGKRKDNWQAGPWDNAIQAHLSAQGTPIIGDHF